MAPATPLKTHSASGRRFVVRAHYDHETGGWWADSDDIPGLVTEAPSYSALVSRVLSVVPDLCAANNVSVTKGDTLEIEREGEPRVMTKGELNDELSKLGERLWNAIWSDDAVLDAVHALVLEKLRYDGVKEEDTILSEYGAESIFEDSGSANIVRPKRFVKSEDWAKNSHYNLAARWVLSEALARMRIEQTLPWDEISKSDD